jgi:hypothetical protein
LPDATKLVDITSEQLELVSTPALGSDGGLAGAEDRPDRHGENEPRGRDEGDVDGRLGPGEGSDGHVFFSFRQIERW